MSLIKTVKKYVKIAQRRGERTSSLTERAFFPVKTELHTKLLQQEQRKKSQKSKIVFNQEDQRLPVPCYESKRDFSFHVVSSNGETRMNWKMKLVDFNTFIGIFLPTSLSTIKCKGKGQNVENHFVESQKRTSKV